MINKIGINKFYIGGVALVLLILSVSLVSAYWPFTGNAPRVVIPNPGQTKFECKTFDANNPNINLNIEPKAECESLGYPSLCLITENTATNVYSSMRDCQNGANVWPLYETERSQVTNCEDDNTMLHRSYDNGCQIMTGRTPSRARRISSGSNLICCKQKV